MKYGLAILVFAFSLLSAKAAVVVTWLDEPLVIWADFGSQVFFSIDITGGGTTNFIFGTWLNNFIGVKCENGSQVVIYPDPPPNKGGAVEPLAETYLITQELGNGLVWLGDDGYYRHIASWESIGWEVVGSGPFIGQRAYMGIAFYIGDDLHYGWMDLEVGQGPIAWIYGWGYETEANRVIRAGAGSPLTIPEPGTFALLALGGGFLFCRRRKIL